MKDNPLQTAWPWKVGKVILMVGLMKVWSEGQLVGVVGDLKFDFRSLSMIYLGLESCETLDEQEAHS